MTTDVSRQQFSEVPSVIGSYKTSEGNGEQGIGGGGGIRTHGTREGTTVFECGGGRVGTSRFVCNRLM